MARTKAKSKAVKARKPKTAAKTTMKAARTKTTTKLQVGKTPLKKSQIYAYLADATEVSRKQITGVFDALNHVVEEHLKKTGPGEFILPGMLKCKVTRKPATKARKGINPFTGEEMMFKAKPARNVVKIRPLKRLKEMVS